MEKIKVLIIGITLFLSITIFIGCTETNESGNNVGLNELPIPIITFPEGAHPRWWNDTLFVNALESYDFDGDIVDYRWFFETNIGLTPDSSETRAGDSTSYKIPEANFMDGYVNITLAVTDNKGVSSFAYYDIPLRRGKGAIHFEQIDSSTVFNITFVQGVSNGTGEGFLDLFEKEIFVEIYKNGSWDGQLGYFPGYKDVDNDGTISKGDTFDIFDSFWPNYYDGSTVKIDLIGGKGHNRETIVGSLEVEFE
jgi:hypothetical protein